MHAHMHNERGAAQQTSLQKQQARQFFLSYFLRSAQGSPQILRAYEGKSWRAMNAETINTHFARIKSIVQRLRGARGVAQDDIWSLGAMDSISVFIDKCVAIRFYGC